VVQFGASIPGLPARNVPSENKQYGIYIQDDWEATDKLLLNLGVRYDYEETPSYVDFVTPADVIAGLNSVDPSTGALPGQTYVQTLALGGVDIDKYISTGGNRDSYDGAIQPRVGFSYDFSEDESFVLFGGAGRAYDRNVFDYLALERSKGTFPRYEFLFNAPGHACDPTASQRCLEFDPALLERANLEALVAANPNLGREINLINNDLKTPYSDQYSLGVRNRFDFWNQNWVTSATFSYVESKDGIVFLLGNRRGNGSYRENPLAQWEQVPFGNGIPGLGTLLLIDNGIESRTSSFLLSVEKPFTNESNWGVTFAYTYSDAEENRSNAGFFDEHFMFDFPTIGEFGWHTATQVPQHRLVTTGIWDAPWQLTLSAKLLLQSSVEFDALNCRDVPTAAERPPGCARTGRSSRSWAPRTWRRTCTASSCSSRTRTCGTATSRRCGRAASTSSAPASGRPGRARCSTRACPTKTCWRRSTRTCRRPRAIGSSSASRSSRSSLRRTAGRTRSSTSGRSKGSARS
jgi:outer membrane receptor protein involved in Fe transport